jgi:D-glycero-D-manno-heptose 1,7-bisphosphate phosphatase
MENIYTHQFDEENGIIITKLNEKYQNTKWKGTLLLDRDGVVIEEKHYLRSPDNVKLIKGTANIIRTATRNRWYVGIITNQSGIARGYFDVDEYIEVTKRMLAMLAEEESYIQIITACPFHKCGTRNEFIHDNHPMRKPNPGMIQFITRGIQLDKDSKSILVGDKICDLEAGINYGVDTIAHVYTGHGRTQRDYIEQKYKNCGLELLLIDSLADLSSFKDFGIH